MSDTVHVHSSCCTTTFPTSTTWTTFWCCWQRGRAGWRREEFLTPTRLLAPCFKTGQGMERGWRTSKTGLLSSYLFRSLADHWGISVDFTTSYLHSSWFVAFRSSIFHSRPVHSLMLSSHCFLCLPLRLPRWTVPCRIVLASPGDRVACPCPFRLHLFTEVRRSSHGPMAGARRLNSLTDSRLPEKFVIKDGFERRRSGLSKNLGLSISGSIKSV